MRSATQRDPPLPGCRDGKRLKSIAGNLSINITTRYWVEMAQKRNAKEAFGAPKGKISLEVTGNPADGPGQLSAAAAARQARLVKDQALETEGNDLIGSIAREPYDGHHSGNISGEDEDAEPVLKKTNLPEIRFSTFDPNFAGALQEHRDGSGIKIALRADQTATFIGEYDLEVLKGVVNVYGAMIHPDLGPQRVHALSTLSLPSITARSDSTIHIMSVKSGLSQLSKLSPLFRNIGCDPKEARSFQFLASNTSDPLNRPLQPLEIDDSTKRILSSINAKLDSTTTTICAIGSKSCGKSTFNRLLTNMIISRPGAGRTCWYLDLDPGQPEFTPPGQISLVEVSVPILGPPYTHRAHPSSTSFRLVRSHTLAATSFKDDAEHYLSCAADLLSSASLTEGDLPIIINSCGWASGLGASTLISLIASFPADIQLVFLGDSPEVELSPTLPTHLHSYNIPRRPRVQSSRTPAEQRAMATMAYFHSKQNGRDIGWNPKPIGTIKPWLLPYGKTADRGIKAILSYGQAPHPEFLAETLEGAVVAIVATTPGLITSTEMLGSLSVDILRTEAEGLPYLAEEIALDPKSSFFVGLGLIRGIDVERRVIQLLTPVDFEQAELEERDVVLVRGSGFDSPDWAYLEDLYSDPKATGERPWVALTGESNVEHGKVWRVRRPPLAGGKG